MDGEQLAHVKLESRVLLMYVFACNAILYLLIALPDYAYKMVSQTGPPVGSDIDRAQLLNPMAIAPLNHSTAWQRNSSIATQTTYLTHYLVAFHS